METTDEVQVQLATRIPSAWRQAVKVRAITTEPTIAAFVVAALREKLARETRKAARS